jgi:hypothetical protein
MRLRDARGFIRPLTVVAGSLLAIAARDWKFMPPFF